LILVNKKTRKKGKGIMEEWKGGILEENVTGSSRDRVKGYRVLGVDYELIG
jgi:hypothetical protein